ncbi:MAG: hypothetical protein RL139_1560 [Gemmatimonadota bacterium]|jgi:hypothetical protein
MSGDGGAMHRTLKALSPMRIISAALREWFAPHGPGRKITLAVIYAETSLRMLPLLVGNPAAVEYLVMGMAVVFGGTTLTQGLVGDRMRARPEKKEGGS